MGKTQLGVLVSGHGSNLKAIIDAAKTPVLELAEVAVVISNKSDAYALERARKAGIPAVFIDPKIFPDRKEFYLDVIFELEKRNVALVCLAGFLLKLEPNIVEKYKDRILNIHPALLPAYGGKGMYGRHVHEAVLNAKDKESGCTVHVVDEEFDRGPIVLQKKVPVLPTDNPETLAGRVLAEEHKLYPEAIALYIKEKL